jgi:hypothetical protein
MEFDRRLWSTRFERSYEVVVRQTDDDDDDDVESKHREIGLYPDVCVCACVRVSSS